MPAPPRLSRRTALLGGLGTTLGTTLVGAALSGCDADDLKPHDSRPTASATVTAPAGRATPDEQLVDAVGTEVLAALGTALAVRRRPELRDPLAVVVRTHRRHLAALHQHAKAPHVVAPRELSAAVGAILAAESTLKTQLVDAAVQAESGTLAVLLASMSASVGQLVTVLAELPVTP